jgi:hypothetical protein
MLLHVTADAGVARRSPDSYMGGTDILLVDTHLVTISTICRKKKESTRLPTMTEVGTSYVVTHQTVKGEARLSDM